MTPEDVDRIRSSFDGIWPVSERTADLFYDRLFAVAPATRGLFRSDMAEQKRKFIATLAAIVGALDNVPVLLSMTETLGRHHAGYGVRPEHYEAVGDALLWSLENGLGRAWTPEVAESWRKAYAFIARDMIAHA